jgi:hypothetical protein
MDMKLTSLLCGLFFLGVTITHADLYQWTDAQGVTHVVDDTGSIPDAYHDKVKTYRTAKPTNSQASLLAPSRAYPENSQGAFAQKLALDLGLIKNPGEDALGPLGTTGIQPAGGWQVYDSLTPETQADVIAAARRAANSQRLRVSADGAEAIVRQAAIAFLPPPPLVDEYEEEAFYDQGPEIIVEQQPPQIIEVIREPVYIPQPVIEGVPYRHGHRGKRLDKPRRALQENAAKRSSGFSTPAPTHMPFGTSHMPFGTSHMPFGTSHMPSGSGHGARER